MTKKSKRVHSADRLEYRHMSKILWLTGIICAGFMFATYRNLAADKRDIPCPRCNIVVIIVDTLRAQSLPCYGYHRQTSPHICNFAARNTLFTHAFANSNWTLPSNMSIMTSLYPESHGMVDPVPGELNPRVVTLAQQLTKAGYDTTFVSEDDENISTASGIAHGFIHVILTPRTLTDDTLGIWKHAVDSITIANAKNRPAFIYFHTSDIHDYVRGEFSPPPSFPLDQDYHSSGIPIIRNFTNEIWKLAIQNLTYGIQRSTDRTDIAKLIGQRNELKSAPTIQKAREIFSQLSPAFQNSIFESAARSLYAIKHFDDLAMLQTHLYDNTIRLFDMRMDTFFQHMTRSGLSDNTIVIFTSDHGEYLGEHRLIGHTVGLSDEVTRIPLIVRIPGVPTQVISSLVQHIDIYPTILDAVGIHIPKDIAGISLKAILLHWPNAPRNSFVLSQTSIPKEASIRTDTWRYVRKYNGNEVLYELSNPEEIDVSTMQPAIVKSFSTQLTHIQQSQPTYLPIRSALSE